MGHMKNLSMMLGERPVGTTEAVEEYITNCIQQPHFVQLGELVGILMDEYSLNTLEAHQAINYCLLHSQKESSNVVQNEKDHDSRQSVSDGDSNPSISDE